MGLFNEAVKRRKIVKGVFSVAEEIKPPKPARLTLGPESEETFQQAVAKGKETAIASLRDEKAPGRIQESATYNPKDFRSTPSYSRSYQTYEEPPIVKKNVDITDAQYQRYLQRVADRTPSGQKREMQLPGQGPVKTQQAMGDQAAQEMMGQYQAEPQLFGRLHETLGEGISKPVDMPLNEAQSTYMKDRPEMGGAGRYQALDQYIPPVDQLSTGGGGVAPELSRKEWRTFGRKSDKLVESAQKAGSLPTRKKDAVPEPTQIESLVNQTRVLDMMWNQLIGGGRTIQGREWKDMMSRARGYKKSDAPNPKDHFMKVGLKWMRDKDATGKTYPRESVKLEKLWQTLNQQE